jgi:hypothetical protein
MDNVITTEESKSTGRLKADVSSRMAKKKMLKKVLGRGGPSLSSFKPVGYGKIKSSKKKSLKSVSSGSSKKLKKTSASSLIKSLLKGSKASKGFKFSKLKMPKMAKVKKIKIKSVKGLIKSYS